MRAWARPAQDAAFVVLAALPLAMAIANRSAPALLVVAALLSVAGRALSGGLPDVGRRLRRLLSTPLALACLAFLGWAAISLGWSQHQILSAHALGELVLAAGAPLVLAASLPHAIPPRIMKVAAGLMAAGCLWVLIELATGSALRAALGFRSEYFIFKRSVTAILVVFWPLALLLWTMRRRTITLVIGAALAAAILWSHAAAASLGFVVALLCLGIAHHSRLMSGRIALAALLAFVAIAPVTGELASRALSEPLLDRLHDMQARDRIVIWQSFGEVVRVRPILGTGFGTSAALGRDTVAAEVPADRRLMLAVGHPHNGYLQIWTETGAVGAVLAAFAFVLLLGTVMRLPPEQVLPALAIIACAGTIMLVAHGAWQGWWIATLGAAAVWTMRLPSTAAGAAQSAGSAARPRKPVAST